MVVKKLRVLISEFLSGDDVTPDSVHDMWESGRVGWQMLQVITVSPFDISWNTVLGILLGQYASHCIPVIWVAFTFIYSYESKVVAVHTIMTHRGSRSVAILILGLNITWK